MNKDLINSKDSERANTITRELQQITIATKNNFFTVCSMLLEFYENDYHKFYGYTKFGEWVENANLDIGSRNAYNYVLIAKRTRELGLDKEKLIELPISSLKEILSLDPEKFETNIRGLLEEAETLSFDEVKNKVRGLKSESGEEVYCHLNFKLTEEVKEIVMEAFELARKLNGSAVDKNTGEVKDISDSRCLEFMAASFLQDPNNFPEKRSPHKHHEDVITEA